jgi:hypothetical protein
LPHRLSQAVQLIGGNNRSPASTHPLIGPHKDASRAYHWQPTGSVVNAASAIRIL